jgi:hypothetical protein
MGCRSTAPDSVRSWWSTSAREAGRPARRPTSTRLRIQTTTATALNGCAHGCLGSGTTCLLGRGCLYEPEVPGVLVVEAARHAAAQLQPVLFELPNAGLLVPGRAVCPALGPGGRWTPRHAARPPGASDEANEVGHGSPCRPMVGSGAELVGGACGWGSGMPAPSGQIPPPWARWENEAPAARAACRSSQAQLSRWSQWRDLTLCRGEPHGRALSGPGGVPDCRGPGQWRALLG